MIRVLYTINNLDTAGSKYVVANLARSLDRQRFTPCIAVGRKSGSALERELESVCAIEEINLHLSHRSRLPRELQAAVRRLRGLADVAHSLDYSSDWTEPLAMRLAGIPWVMQKPNLNWDARRWWLRCFLAWRIVCLSQAQVELMTAWRRKIAHIPIGIDLDRFQSALPLSRQEHGLSADDLLLGSVAHLVPVKGHLELLRALAAVALELPRLKLILVGQGDPDYTQELTSLSVELGLTGRVIFWGASSQVPSILKMCDGHILATRNTGRRDAFPAAVIEAMAAGLPSIATRCGGPEEIMVDGETGWLVDAEDAEPLAGAMRAFYSNTNLRLAYGAAGQQRARELFGRELMAARNQTLYESLLK
jgi:glycosyltransferase involved in cell wall biosynthesis